MTLLGIKNCVSSVSKWFFCEDADKRALVEEQAAALFAHYKRELMKENET